MQCYGRLHLFSNRVVVSRPAAMPDLGEDDRLAGSVDPGAAASRAHPPPLVPVARVQPIPVATFLQQRTIAIAIC